MAKPKPEKHPGGRPKGSKNKDRTKARTSGEDASRRKNQPCKNLARAGHGTDWHCDICNDTGEVSG